MTARIANMYAAHLSLAVVAVVWTTLHRQIRYMDVGAVLDMMRQI